MASRNFGNVKAAAVKRHPGSNITGVPNFERGLQLLRTPQRSQTPLSRLARTFSTARSQALGGAAGSLETRDADYVGGVAGTCTGSASLRRLATAACAATAACLLRTFSTAFLQPAVFTAALSLRSICLLRSFSIAFPKVLAATTCFFKRLSIGPAIAGQ